MTTPGSMVLRQSWLISAIALAITCLGIVATFIAVAEADAGNAIPAACLTVAIAVIAYLPRMIRVDIAPDKLSYRTWVTVKTRHYAWRDIQDLQLVRQAGVIPGLRLTLRDSGKQVVTPYPVKNQNQHQAAWALIQHYLKESRQGKA